MRNIYRYRGAYGYFYEHYSKLYYLQTRFYDPAIGRFLNADDTDYLNASGTTLGCNLYAYCENDAVNKIDSYGTWAERYSGFKRTSTGFSVKVNASFLSRKFCIRYAKDVAMRYGYWHWWWGYMYKKMSVTRMAQEIWFHALVYYVGTPLKRVLSSVSITWTWLEDKISRASVIDVNYDDSRAWVYAIVWNVGAIVKNNIRRYIGWRWYMPYIIL